MVDMKKATTPGPLLRSLLRDENQKLRLRLRLGDEISALDPCSALRADTNARMLVDDLRSGDLNALRGAFRLLG